VLVLARLRYGNFITLRLGRRVFVPSIKARKLQLFIICPQNCLYLLSRNTHWLYLPWYQP